jgi:hypothetical protein
MLRNFDFRYRDTAASTFPSAPARLGTECLAPYLCDHRTQARHNAHIVTQTPIATGSSFSKENMKSKSCLGFFRSYNTSMTDCYASCTVHFGTANTSSVLFRLGHHPHYRSLIAIVDCARPAHARSSSQRRY